MRAFGRALEWGMRHRWLTIVASLVAFGASVYGLGFVQQQFFPASNRPELLVTMTLPKNASIAATEAQTERLEKVLASSPDISRFSSYVGGGAIRFYLPLDVQLDNDFLAETVIVAKDLEARDRVQAMLQQRLARDFPDVTARVSRLELGPPVGWPVQYRVSAPTTDEARHYAEEVMDVLRGSGLVRNVNYDWAEKSKELRIVVDQDRVRQAGLSSEQLANALNRVISGSTVTQVRDLIYLVDLVVRAKADERSSIEALTNLQITTPTGATVPLRELATFQYELDEGYVWRRGRLPTITVQAEPLPGVEPSLVNQRITAALETVRASMPAGTLLEVGGTVEKSDQSNAAILAQVPLMIALMLTALMVQLGSFRQLALVISVAPLGLIGVVAALLITGTPMGFIAILGSIALAGMIIRNSVILVAPDRARAGAGCRSLAGGDRRDQAQVPADHADRRRSNPRHDPDHARRVLGADGLCHRRRSRRRHRAHTRLPPGPLCRCQRHPGEGRARRSARAGCACDAHARNTALIETEAAMPETPPSLLDRFLRSDATMYAGPGEITRDYVDKMLLAALQEAQSVVRSYDTKAQIVGVGYILALNLVLHFGDLLPTHAPLGPLFFAVVWGVVIMPILQFGQVLYPSRTRAEKELRAKMSGGSEQRIYYVDPDTFADLRDFVHHALRSDWTSVLAAELLKTSRVRIIKQARFRRGLMMTVVSFIVLGGEQFVRSLTIA